MKTRALLTNQLCKYSIFHTLSYITFKGGGDIADELRKEVHCLRQQVDQLEAELEAKSSEIKQLSASHKMSDISQVS